MSNLVLNIKGVNKTFGGLQALNDVNLEIEEGKVHAIIGPNGAGKTTLISQLSGDLAPDGGQVEFQGEDITHAPAWTRALMGLARSFQITSIVHELTMIDNVALSVQAHAGHSFRFWQPAREATELQEPALAALRQVGLEDRAHVVSRNVSHGEHRQLEIAMALAANPSLLMLDEPMAGMGSDESAKMVNILSGLKGQKSMLLIEHDMDAVFALADRITVLVYGRAIATGTPEEIRENEDVRKAYLGDEAA